MRAYVYLRQSLGSSAISRQREACRRLCRQRGWEIVGEYADADRSAWSGKARPEYTRMLAAAEKGGCDAIVAYHVDRLTRRMADLEHLITVATKHDITIATVTGDLDLSNDQGRLIGRILASVASAEVERKGARQRLANAESAKLGKPAGGFRPVGYDDDRVTVRPDEARFIRQGYRRILAGGSLRGVAREWNAAGFTTARGNPWRPDAVRTVLRNPRYSGQRARLNPKTRRWEIVGKASWRGIVTKDTFDAVAAILADPGRRTTPDTRRKYLLSGLATCGLCGALVDTGRTQHGVRTYKCSASRHLSRGAEPLDDYVTRVVLARLSRDDARDLLVDDTRPDVEQLREQAQTLRARLDELAALYAAGTVTATQLATGTEALRATLVDVEGRMADVAKVDVLAPLVDAQDAARVWDGLDVDRQRAVISTLMTITLLSPGRGRREFDPASVQIAWR